MWAAMNPVAPVTQTGPEVTGAAAGVFILFHRRHGPAARPEPRPCREASRRAGAGPLTPLSDGA
jgi:hypothetical protein